VHVIYLNNFIVRGFSLVSIAYKKNYTATLNKACKQVGYVDIMMMMMMMVMAL